MEHLLIVNPVAGKGRTMKMIPEIEAFMQKHSLSYKIEVTKAPKHACIIARDYIKEYRKLRIYAVGGDGTLNEVLQGTVGSDACLGIVPAGTGNDFLKTFCPISDPLKLLPFIIFAESIAVDVCKLNDMYYLNIASAGFDADVVANTQHFKNLPLLKGNLAYILGILQSLIRLKTIHVSLFLDNEKTEVPPLLLTAFANGKYYGGGMMPAPDAIPDDGLLDVCIIREMKRLDILRFFPKMIKGMHTNMPQVSIQRCRKLNMVSSRPVHVNADGELFKATEINVELIHKGLQFIKPVDIDLK